jgi:hypothetical protein
MFLIQSLDNSFSRLFDHFLNHFNFNFNFNFHDHYPTTFTTMSSVAYFTELSSDTTELGGTLQLETVIVFEPTAQDKSPPADPSAPSLLTLPAEIRNAVYETLFPLLGGIHISPSDFYLKRLCSLS